MCLPGRHHSDISDGGPTLWSSTEGTHEESIWGQRTDVNSPVDNQHNTWAWSTSVWACKRACHRHVGIHPHASHSSPWAAVCVCALCCHLIAAAVCSPFPSFSPSLYLLRCVYLTHSSQRGNKLALNNNLTDNYSQAATRRKEYDNKGQSPFLLILPSSTCGFYSLYYDRSLC